MAATQERSHARTGPGRLVWGLGLWVAGVLLLAVLAVFAIFFDRFPADERIADALQDVDVPAFGGFLDFVNALGHSWLAIGLVVVLTIGFAWVRAGSEAVLVLLTLAPRAVNVLLKDWVERPRPSEELVEVSSSASGFSFPSGHTVATATLFGMLFFLIPVVVRWRPLRWTLQAGCLLMVLAAGPARVYVGVHWPSDVLGGYLLALLILAPVVAAYLTLRPD